MNPSGFLSIKLQKIKIFLHRLKSLKSSRHLLIAAFLVLAIPLTLAMVLSKQNLLSRAASAGIASVAVNPGEVSVQTGKKVAMSALAYNASGEPVHSGVSYEWTLSSSASSAATLSKTTGDISELTGLAAGCSQLTVFATDGRYSVAKSAKVIVADGTSIPDCAGPNQLGFDTDDVSVGASNFHIYIGDEIFYGDPHTIQMHSNVGSPYPSTTTMEVIWQENGVEMRLFMYFKKNPNIPNDWVLSEVRTYDGTYPGDWIYYALPNGSNGEIIHGPFGQETNFGNVQLNGSSTNGAHQGRINFENLTIFPFRNYSPSVSPSPSPSPSPSQGPTIKTATFYPVADSYVNSGHKTTNYGKVNLISIDGTPSQIGYFKFDLSKIKNNHINKATLRIKTPSSSTANSSGTFRIWTTSNLWQESLINFNNKPNLGKQVGSFSNPKSSQTINVDLTSWLGGFLPNATISAAINTASSNETLLRSKEATDLSNRPQLIIEYQ